MKKGKKNLLRGLTLAVLVAVCAVFGLAGCESTPVLQTTAPTGTTQPPVFTEPELPEREVGIQTYYVLGEWKNSRVTAGSEDGTYGPFRSQDFNTFTKWNPEANPGYTGEPGILYMLDKEYDLNKIVFTFSGKPYYFKLYVSADDENYTQIADICRTNADQAYTDSVCTLDGLGLEGIRYIKLVFTGCEGGNTWVNFKEVEFFESGDQNADTAWMIPPKPETAVIVKGEPIGTWNKDHVSHSVNPMVSSFDNDTETKWNPQAKKGYTGNPGVVYTLEQAYDIKRIELNFGKLRHYFELYVSSDGKNYKRIANICTLNEDRAYSGGVCKLDGLNLKGVQYVKLVFTGRSDNQTWVNLFELSLYEKGSSGLSTGWMNPYIEKSLPITKAQITGQWNKDNINHAQHPLTASYDNNLSTKWNPAAKGGFGGDPGVVYTLDKAYTLKRLELTFTHDHHYFDVYVSADGTQYKKIAAISGENAEKAYGSKQSLVCTLDGLKEENVKYIKLIFTGRVANTTWVNLVEFKALNSGKEGLDTAWMLPYVEESLKIADAQTSGTWLYDNVEHAQHPLAASYDGNMTSKWNPAAQGGFAGEPGVVYILESPGTVKRLELTFTHDHHYFDVYVSADGTQYKKIAAISAENGEKAYGTAESLVCTLDGLTEENVKYIKLVFTGRVANTTWVNLVELKAFNTGTDGLDISWMLPEQGEEPTDPSEPTDPTEPSDPTEPTYPEQPDDTLKIVSHSLTGVWVLGREGDPNVGPQLSYDGNAATKWNPQASGNYAKEQGIIYTLNGWYDLESVKCTFSTADMYFEVYVSSDGTQYTKLGEVTDETLKSLYTGATCTIGAAAGKAVKYVKLMFTGRANGMDYVNLFEVEIAGVAVEKPETEETVIQATITANQVIGAWVNDQIWDDGSEDLNVGPYRSYDGDPATKWNPQASGNYAMEQGIIYTLDGWYDLERVQCTFSAPDMYFEVYGSSDGVEYTKLGAVTAENLRTLYSGNTCTVDATAGKQVKYIKLMVTGRANGMNYVNLYEVEVFGIRGETPELPETPTGVKAGIIANEVVGDWVLKRLGDVTIGPEKAYDGNTGTKWNPQVKGGYTGSPGIIFTLDKAYDLQQVKLQFAAADVQYFELYGSADGESYTPTGAVTDGSKYSSGSCTVDVTDAKGMRYLKVKFTGKNGNSTWVNFYEIEITGLPCEDTSA